MKCVKYDHSSARELETKLSTWAPKAKGLSKSTSNTPKVNTPPLTVVDRPHHEIDALSDASSLTDIDSD
jgi:hypothetical protein